MIVTGVIVVCIMPLLAYMASRLRAWRAAYGAALRAMHNEEI